ncbi:MAG TPA: methyltransferase domain-containing protein [Phycisphaerae bacterium]|nr:methyltransferase domain-containing protein [Phycisphaerae bacterium]
MGRSGSGLVWRMVVALGLWAVAVLPLSAGEEEQAPSLDVPYVPTHQKAVDEMLKLANVATGDYVIDLGCGDGRIVVTAAKKYKVRGLGVDLDPKRLRESKRNAEKAGVTDLVEFRKEDVMITDVSKANVVTLFLLEDVNVRLRPKLLCDLKPGSRVVSNTFTMRDWQPEKTLNNRFAYGKKIYFWTIPAKAGGTWTWQTKLSDKEVPGCLKLQQEFQAVKGTVSCPDAADAPIAEASLNGTDLRFTAAFRVGSDQVTVAYHGTVDGDAIRGTQEWRGGACAGSYPWTVARKPVDLAGKWQLRAPEQAEWNGTLHVRREAAGLKAAFVRDAEPDKELPLPGLYVWGASVRFEVPSGGWSPLAFRGTFGPDAAEGTVAPEGEEKQTPWTAKRLATSG